MADENMGAETRLHQLSVFAVKRNATLFGISVDEYRDLLARGLSRCRTCKAWKSRSEFHRNKNISTGLSVDCKPCMKVLAAARYVPVPLTERRKRGAQQAPPRDGDKKQARRRIQYLIKACKIPNPNTVSCVDCGHLGQDHRHEYDHHMGYGAEHHETVEVVCKPCHFRRERALGTYEYLNNRDALGRVCTKEKERNE
jgi:hypothetical protein